MPWWLCAIPTRSGQTQSSADCTWRNDTARNRWNAPGSWATLAQLVCISKDVPPLIQARKAAKPTKRMP
eukprot:scaffold537_cov241-Pinguiococcus_pyrenoidosus.AAC.18